MLYVYLPNTIWKLPGVVFPVAREWVGVRAVEIPKWQRCCSLVATFVTQVIIFGIFVIVTHRCHLCHQEIISGKPPHIGILFCEL